MRRFVIYLTLTILLPLCANAQGYVEYKEDITNVVLQLPEQAVITRQEGFQKAKIELEKTTIFISSMKNEKGKQYSWDEVNNFDNKNRYGKLLHYERATGEIDGWVRYYADKTKRGTPFTTCVVLVRGKDYAFYMVESAYNEAELSIPKILQSASFPKATLKKNYVGKYRNYIPLLYMFLPLILFHILKKLSQKTYLIVAILTLIGFLVLDLCIVHTSWGDLAVYMIISIFAWWLTYDCKSWSDAFHKLSKIINN